MWPVERRPPRWNESEVDGLMRVLGWNGLGFLSRDRVCEERERLATATAA